jgi:hypothetical protein
MASSEDLAHRLVSAALTFPGAYVFGGYIRDALLGEGKLHPDSDVDVTFPDERSMYHFSDMMLAIFPDSTRRVVQCTYGPMERLCSLCVRPGGDSAPSVNVDCVVRGTRGQCPDFSCNSLKLTSEGDIQLWCTPEFHMCSLHRIDQVQKSIRDIKAKRFEPYPLPPRMRKKQWALTCAKTLDRAARMIDRGWVMRPRKDTHCCVYPDANDPVLQGTPHETVKSQLQDKCNVCFNEWGSGGKVVVTNCLHVFHLDCLTKWLRTCPKGAVECPKCRSKEFLF